MSPQNFHSQEPQTGAPSAPTPPPRPAGHLRKVVAGAAGLAAVAGAGIFWVTQSRQGAAPQGATDEKTGYEFVGLAGGPLTMGCVENDKECAKDEKPRQVDVKPFLLGKTKVLTSQYALCVKEGKCSAGPMEEPAAECNGQANRLDHPINCIDWQEATTFCAWLGGRLPWAHEWEWEAKGGDNRLYPWGNELPDATRAHFEAKQGTAPWNAHPAGASQHGLLDLVGNVWEWTGSKYDSTMMELRGGSWFVVAKGMRASNRGNDDPTGRFNSVGVRCARSVR